MNEIKIKFSYLPHFVFIFQQKSNQKISKFWQFRYKNIKIQRKKIKFNPHVVKKYYSFRNVSFLSASKLEEKPVGFYLHFQIHIFYCLLFIYLLWVWYLKIYLSSLIELQIDLQQTAYCAETPKDLLSRFTQQGHKSHNVHQNVE